MTLKVGLTGGIGCGKSTVLGRLAGHGVPVLDADDCVRALQEPGQAGYQAIVEAFGPECLAADGTLNRGWLRARVFADESARRRLEAVLHPAVRDAIAQWCARQTAAYCVVAIPLLVETGDYPFLDRVVVIECEPAQQIARVAARSGIPTADIEAIIQAQASTEERRAIADDLLDNGADEAALFRQIDALHRELSAACPSESGH